MAALDDPKPGCLRCEALPAPLPASGTLYLRFPIAHSFGKIARHLKDTGSTVEETGGVLAVKTGRQSLESLLAGLCGQLTSVEQDDVRVLFQADGQTLQMADYLEATSVRELYARSRSGWLSSIISNRQLTMWFQPLVAAGGDNALYAYECLMRGRDENGVVFPNQMLEVANGADMLFQLDLAARRAAIEQAARHRIQSRLFINFTPTAIYDPKFCLRSTVAAVDAAGLTNDRIVFEVVESEQVADSRHLRNVLDYYRTHGFGVALDDLGSGYSSLNMLHELRPDFVKLDMGLIRGIDQDPYKALIAQKLLEVAQGLGIRTVAEGVETQGEFGWLRAHGADFVQGYLFAKPAEVPPLPKVLQAA